MILEGIVTSLDAGGKLNVAPMGPIVEPDMTRLVLRPFRTSQTYRNLKQRPSGVFHVVDDVLLLAQGAIGRIDPPPETFPAERVDGRVLRSACRWYEFEIESLDDSRERTEIVARIVHTGRLRDVFGFNRAKHAVLEAAILATRLHLLPREDIQRQLAALKVTVDKTAGPQEHEAFILIDQHVARFYAATPPVEGVRIRTGARLHFGPLAVGAESGRAFGGVGMMIESPGFAIAAHRLREDAGNDMVDASPELVEPIRRAMSSYRSTLEPRTPHRPVRIAVEASTPAHAGFGSGTQLALAVGRALARLDDRTLDPLELARSVGRGARSAIGIHGFARGGLLVDGGKRTADDIGTLVARADVPDWRIVLVTPPGEGGLSGIEERQAFARLRPMASAVTERLCRLALLDLLPAVHDADFRAAAKALFEYGHTVGEYFAPAQGGIYAHPTMRGLVPRLRAGGFEGVGQTSWGPSLFVLAPDDEAAARVRTIVERNAPGCRILTTHPANHGTTEETLVM